MLMYFLRFKVIRALFTSFLRTRLGHQTSHSFSISLQFNLLIFTFNSYLHQRKKQKQEKIMKTLSLPLQGQLIITFLTYHISYKKAMQRMVWYKNYGSFTVVFRPRNAESNFPEVISCHMRLQLRCLTYSCLHLLIFVSFNFKHKIMTMIMIMAIPNAMHPPITPHILLSVRPVRAPVLGPINVAVVVSPVRGSPPTTGY